MAQTNGQQTMSAEELVRPWITVLQQASQKSTDPKQRQYYSNLYNQARQSLVNANTWTGAIPTSAPASGSIDWDALRAAAQKASNIDPGTNQQLATLKGIGNSVLQNLPALQKVVGVPQSTGLLPSSTSTVTTGAKGASNANLPTTPPWYATVAGQNAQPVELGGATGNPVAAAASTAGFGSQNIGVSPSSSLGIAIDTYIKTNKIQTPDDFYASLYKAGSNENTIKAYQNIQKQAAAVADYRYKAVVQQAQNEYGLGMAEIAAKYANVAAQYKENAHNAIYTTTNEWAARGLAFSGMLNRAIANIQGDLANQLNQSALDRAVAELQLRNTLITATLNASLDQIQSNLSAYTQYGLEVARLMDSDNKDLADTILKGLSSTTSSSGTSGTGQQAYTSTMQSQDKAILQDKTGLYSPTNQGVAGLRLLLGTQQISDNKTLAAAFGGSLSIRNPTVDSTGKETAPRVITPRIGSLSETDFINTLQYADTPTQIKAAIVWNTEHTNASLPSGTKPITYAQNAYDYFTAHPEDAAYKADVYAFLNLYEPYGAKGPSSKAGTGTKNTFGLTSPFWGSKLAVGGGK
jgi:hypothetical protein